MENSYEKTWSELQKGNLKKETKSLPKMMICNRLVGVDYVETEMKQLIT